MLRSDTYAVTVMILCESPNAANQVFRASRHVLILIKQKIYVSASKQQVKVSSPLTQKKQAPS